MEQSIFRANLRGFDQVDKTACYTSGFRGRFFSLLLPNDHGQGCFTQTKTFSIANFFNAKIDQNVKFPKTALKVRPPNIFEKFNFLRPFSIKTKLH